jgi:cytochrome bd-type quinol oxidase subunit 1
MTRLFVVGYLLFVFFNKQPTTNNQQPTTMSQLERMIKMAEDELTEYSTDARKMEKLRRKIGISVSATEQRLAKEALSAQMQPGGIRQLIEEQRQTVALPFWGIAGLGLLGAISLSQALGYVAAVAGAVAAYRIQKWGWELQAKRLLLNTLEDIEARVAQPRQ